ncbi:MULTISPECIES: YaaC family protein [Halanaerobium]|jgi:hypothetical protein|uniref:YaaC-like protein n=1 Tax=Halanaerobium congolense TaxID=54121 RepID=A0A1G9RK00_9FIRM|nr:MULTISPECIES: YaaC family protein [Halanaerobium]PUU90583.1 MAG: hypothetical protein CI949_2296 [Halanaerobium sp.]PXV66734.1 YaaC-like protein [Halanaerobium congolense]SDK60725.1 YaaC-like Protein [Halanaerobium congolense]SDM23612.1 YaaC-like Protein [Halanaerobium congolense]
MDDIWSKISLFESKDLVKKFYKNKHDRELNSGKAEEIVSSISQGKEYFNSAKDANEIVAPLLFYYGVLSLSRGAILFLDPFLRATSLKPSHGLETTSWNNVLCQGISRIPDLKVKINNGTFLELWEVTKNTEIFSVFTNIYPNRMDISISRNEDDNIGNNIAFKEVLSRIPELSRIFEQTFDDYSKCYKSIAKKHSRYIKISILESGLGLPDKDLIKEEFKLPNDIDIEEKDDHDLIRGAKNISFSIPCSSLEEFKERVPLIKNDNEQNIYIVTPIDNVKVSSLLNIYLTSFFLGMFVRYYPTHWMKLITNSNGDFSYPILKKSISVIEHKFPRLIFEKLEH